MRYDFETISDRNEMGSRKWEIRSEQFPNLKKDVVPFSSADMEFKNAPEIIDGLKKRLDNLVLGYCAPTERFFNSIINWDKKRHNADIKRNGLLKYQLLLMDFRCSKCLYEKRRFCNDYETSVWPIQISN